MCQCILPDAVVASFRQREREARKEESDGSRRETSSRRRWDKKERGTATCPQGQNRPALAWLCGWVPSMRSTRNNLARSSRGEKEGGEKRHPPHLKFPGFDGRGGAAPPRIEEIDQPVGKKQANDLRLQLPRSVAPVVARRWPPRRKRKEGKGETGEGSTRPIDPVDSEPPSFSPPRPPERGGEIKGGRGRDSPFLFSHRFAAISSKEKRDRFRQPLRFSTLYLLSL